VRDAKKKEEDWQLTLLQDLLRCQRAEDLSNRLSQTLFGGSDGFDRSHGDERVMDPGSSRRNFFALRFFPTTHSLTLNFFSSSPFQMTRKIQGE